MNTAENSVQKPPRKVLKILPPKARAVFAHDPVNFRLKGFNAALSLLRGLTLKGDEKVLINFRQVKHIRLYRGTEKPVYEEIIRAKTCSSKTYGVCSHLGICVARKLARRDGQTKACEDFAPFKPFVL